MKNMYEITPRGNEYIYGKIFLPKSGFALCSDFLTSLEKGIKMAEREGNSTIFIKTT